MKSEGGLRRTALGELGPSGNVCSKEHTLAGNRSTVGHDKPGYHDACKELSRLAEGGHTQVGEVRSLSAYCVDAMPKNKTIAACALSPLPCPLNEPKT
jgi:hypothetical protein